MKTSRAFWVNYYLRKILGLNEARSEDKKLASAAQTLQYEQRKELIKTLFEQYPKHEPLADSISSIGDLETATIEIRQQVAKSIERTTAQLSKPEQ